MKIYFIEGLPGSGKTSMAKKIHAHLKSLGRDVELFIEGDLHPVDLAWIAMFNEHQYQEIKRKYPMLKDQIESLVVKDKQTYYLAYTQVKLNKQSKNFYDDCEQYEIYKQDDLSTFLSTHISRFESFIQTHKSQDTIYIFECVLIQNHINELVLKYGYKTQQIIQYFKMLMAPLTAIDFEIFYIHQKNVDKILANISEQRRTNDKNLYKDWIDHVINYISSLPYGKQYTDNQGCLTYFKSRQEEELALLKHLNDHVSIIPLEDDYDAVWLRIKELVNEENFDV